MRFLPRSLGRRWWALLGATIGGGLLAAAVSVALPVDERATATIVVAGPTASRELQLTYADLLVSDAYLAGVASDLGEDPDDLREGLRAVPSPGTTVIEVVVTDGDGDDAIEQANAVAQSFPAFLERTGLGAPESARVVELAESSRKLDSLRANAAVGAAAGLLAGAAALALLEGRAGRAGAASQRPTESEQGELVA
jgi:capsular polysaccharide biosynthesis protein